MRFAMLLAPALAMLPAWPAAGQTAGEVPQSAAGVTSQTITPPTIDSQASAAPVQQALPEAPEPRRAMPEEELKQAEHQRLLGVIPNFISTNDPNAPPLTPKQKLTLAFRSATDPFSFAAAGLDAGKSQAEDDFHDYGQSAQGFAKRYAASYTDSFNGTMLANAIFPILLREDPRYFRKGTGSIKRRFFYSVSTAFWSRRDNGSWGPNYSNVMGSLAAGGLSNLYYPSSDRGAALTIERAFTDAAEGAIGSLLIEFLPDVEKRLHRKKNKSGTGEPTAN